MDRAAWQSERAVCLGRIVFFAAILARFFTVTSKPLPALAITTGALGHGILFSLGVLLFVRRPPAPRALPWASVAVDGVACFGALLPNALFPSAEYPGILLLPDTAGLLVATVAAGLRLLPSAALFAGAVNGASLLVLVGVDRAVSGPRFEASLQTASVYLLWVAGSTMVAAVLARMSRRLAVRGAEAALRAERAKQGLWSVLGDHHDLCSMLSSASIDAETLERRLEHLGAERKLDDRACKQLHRIAVELSEGLGLVRAIVAEVKARAVTGLEPSAQDSEVRLAPLLERLVGQSSRRFASVDIRLEPVAAPLAVRVLDGEPGLCRMLGNLLDNACEGNPSGRPSRVRLSAEPAPSAGRVVIRIEDDGPGLGSELVTTGPGSSSKPAGTGVGLSIVRGLAEASGGSLRLVPRSGGGVEARLELLVASDAPGELVRTGPRGSCRTVAVE